MSVAGWVAGKSVWGGRGGQQLRARERDDDGGCALIDSVCHDCSNGDDGDAGGGE